MVKFLYKNSGYILFSEENNLQALSLYKNININSDHKYNAYYKYINKTTNKKYEYQYY